ncbi:MAG: hypothetical protein GYA21_16340 [Myxococcales bacterium]|nr:hypothetical protein [Myxococcales bacterium]
MRRSLAAIAFAGALGGAGPLAGVDRPDAGTPPASPPAPAQQATALAEWEREVLAHIELLIDLEVVEDLDLLTQLDEISILSEGESR